MQPPDYVPVREMPLRLVQPGMTLLQDLRTHMGTLLVPRGFEVTEVFLARLQNLGADILNERVKVMIAGAEPLERGAQA